MSNFFISLGTINKKYFLILIYVISYILYYIYLTENEDESNEVTYFIDCFGYSFGEIFSFFIATKIKYHGITVKKDKSKKKYIKGYLILIIIDAFYMIRQNFYLDYLFRSTEDNELHTNVAIEIILLTLVTYFLLKYKYYIHHFISMAVIAVLSLSIDLILDNFAKSDFLDFVESILFIITDLLVFSYIKYLIEFQYFYFMDIIFIMGLFEFLFYFVCFIIVIIINNVNGSNIILLNFYNFYNDNGAGKMIYRFLFEFIFIASLIGINEVIIVKELTPNHIIIAYQLSSIFVSLIYIEGINKWIIIIIYIFQIIFLLFFLEILEYNFCSLNRNTKKSIMKREKNQSFDEKDNEIIIDGYDFTEGMKIQKENIEMEMLEKDEDY